MSMALHVLRSSKDRASKERGTGIHLLYKRLSQVSRPLGHKLTAKKTLPVNKYLTKHYGCISAILPDLFHPHNSKLTDDAADTSPTLSYTHVSIRLNIQIFEADYRMNNAFPGVISSLNFRHSLSFVPRRLRSTNLRIHSLEETSQVE